MDEQNYEQKYEVPGKAGKITWLTVSTLHKLPPAILESFNVKRHGQTILRLVPFLGAATLLNVRRNVFRHASQPVSIQHPLSILTSVKQQPASVDLPNTLPRRGPEKDAYFLVCQQFSKQCTQRLPSVGDEGETRNFITVPCLSRTKRLDTLLLKWLLTFAFSMPNPTDSLA